MENNKEELEDLLRDKGRLADKFSYKFSATKKRRAVNDAALKKQINTRARGELLLTASKMPQAVLKISGYCKGQAETQKHINYITRYGKLELYLPDGLVLTDKYANKELITEWANDFNGRKNSRDVLKLILSVPENTNHDKFQKAADKFLAKEFGQSNDYAYVLHTDTKKPHVHAIIKMVSFNGKKLDPRKYYIEQLRRNFAKCCREQGIMVEASRRYQRGVAGKSKNTPIRQMRKHKKLNINLDNNSNLTVNSQNKKNILVNNSIPVRNKMVRAEYLKAAIEIYEIACKKTDKATQDKYKKSARILLDFAKNMPQATRLINTATLKIDGKKQPEQATKFKAYTSVLDKLDTHKKSIIAKIEAINKGNNQKDNSRDTKRSSKQEIEQELDI